MLIVAIKHTVDNSIGISAPVQDEDIWSELIPVPGYSELAPHFRIEIHEEAPTEGDSSFLPEEGAFASSYGDGKIHFETSGQWPRLRYFGATKEDSEKPISLSFGNGRCNDWISFESFAMSAGLFVGSSTGDFNKDGAIDIAYQFVDPDSKKIRNYVLYQEDIMSYADPYSAYVIKKMFNDLNHLDAQKVAKIAKFMDDMKQWCLEKAAPEFCFKYVTRAIISILKFCQAPEKFDALDRLLSYIEKHRDSLGDNPTIFQWLPMPPPKAPLGVTGYYDAIEKFTEQIPDPDKLHQILKLFFVASRLDGINNELETKLVDSLIKIANTLYDVELAIMVSSLFNKFENDIDYLPNAREFIGKLASLANKSESHGYPENIFSWVFDRRNVDLDLISKYRILLLSEHPPTYRDIEHAEKTIGIDNALQMYRMFNVTHFGRYHASVLKEVSKISTNSSYKSDKPLMVVITAKRDQTGMFYWGKNFKYDPRIRIVVMEAGSTEEMANILMLSKALHGTPRIIMMTAHGSYDSMTMSLTNNININHDGEFLRWRLGGIYGDERPQVVINACSTGSKEFEYNVAQMWANVLNTDVYAPEHVEGLPWMWIGTDRKGELSLKPIFLQKSIRFLNIGGTHFSPDPQVADSHRDKAREIEVTFDNS